MANFMCAHEFHSYFCEAIKNQLSRLVAPFSHSIDCNRSFICLNVANRKCYNLKREIEISLVNEDGRNLCANQKSASIERDQ